MLEERGYRVAYGVHNHAHIYKQYPNLYWSFGTYLLASAKAARSKAGIYAVYPSYHGCGPDGVLSHWFEDEAKGKPYLSLEIDEHASKVGLITRLEAFINFSLSALPGDAALYAEQNQNAQLLFP
jgi:predicted nucleotide-binding protein (sugar kinase/HSP70/actin superfamily)